MVEKQKTFNKTRLIHHLNVVLSGSKNETERRLMLNLSKYNLKHFGKIIWMLSLNGSQPQRQVECF